VIDQLVKSLIVGCAAVGLGLVGFYLWKTVMFAVLAAIVFIVIGTIVRLLIAGLF
jgi:hypothetical protein